MNKYHSLTTGCDAIVAIETHDLLHRTGLATIKAMGDSRSVEQMNVNGYSKVVRLG